ncbi:MAG TPA: penicillin acylase family protein [Labilithrix sp.]|nr:penicillin acylase family protein [Labilithrix sp.]
MKAHYSCLAVVLPLVLGSVAGCGDDEDNSVHLDGGGGTDAPALEPFKATVRRTSAGVPHVKAADLGGMGYGFGYSFAEDNLCILEEEILTVRGERAKYFGEAPYDLGQTSSKSNTNSDAVYKMLATKEIADKTKAALDPEMQSVVRGFAAGVSRYVRELKSGKHEGRHASCAKEAWTREITDEDMYLRFFKLALLGSSATFIDAIAAAHPVAGDIGAPMSAGMRKARPVSPARIAAGLKEIAPNFVASRQGEFGSNMYAFGSEVTGGGGIQFGNPHFPWYGGERLYQVHLTVPGKMDVEGATLYGVPAVLIGFTDTFAWSHTVSTAYRFTPYGLTLKPGDPFTYIQDGQEKKITAVDLPIEIKGAATQTVRLYRSEYGPMLFLGDSSFDWTSEKAFTIRDANAENFRLVKQFMRWNMAKDLAEFKRIHAEEVATPWVNTTAADKNGDVYYGDLTVVPNVPDDLATTCQIPVLSKALGQSAVGLPLLDGSKKACDWKIDADSPQPGTFGASHLPKVERKDWVVNCNDSFWLTNTKAPTTGFAKIIGRQAYEQSLRSRLCHQQVLDRVAGTDGLPGTNVTVDAVKQIVVGSRLFSAERFKTTVLDGVCPTATVSLTRDPLTKKDITPAVDVATGPACDALKAWDNRVNPDSKGGLVWDELWFRVNAMRNAGTATYKVPFDAADPINTPRDLTIAPADLAQAFAAAVYAVKQAGFAVDAPHSAYVWRAGKGGNSDRIPVPGGFQSVGAFTIAQVKGTPTLKPDTGYGPMTFGNSYMQVVGLTAAGVDASTFVTYSLSTDPASEHYDDYTRLYSTKQWLKAAFTEAEVAADTKSTLELTQ